MNFKRLIMMSCMIFALTITGCGFINKSEKASDLYADKNVDKNIEKAYEYFDSNAKSAIITITESSNDSKTVISFEEANSEDYAIRTDDFSEGKTSSSFDYQGNLYSNLIDNGSVYEHAERMSYIGHNKNFNDLKESNLFQYNHYGLEKDASYVLSSTNSMYEQSKEIYEEAKKKQTLNEDGSIDISIYANVDYLNNKSKEQYDYEGSQQYIDTLNEEYSGFLEKDQLIQDALSKRGEDIPYYKEYYTKIHINDKGFITEMLEFKTKDNYANFVNGVDSSSNDTTKVMITKINNNKVKKDDVDLVSSKNNEDNTNFNERLTVEDTKALKNGDVINKRPDLQTLVNNDLYYSLNEETGVIRLFQLEVAYLSWMDEWDISCVRTFGDGELNAEDKGLIKILEAMPSFQEAKANNPFNGRIDYLGSGKWGY